MRTTTKTKGPIRLASSPERSRQSLVNGIATAYNLDGEVTSTCDSYSNYAFGYNGQGDQTSVDNAGTPGAPQVLLTSQYDTSQNRTSLAATINGTADFINGYSYDTLSRSRNITQQGQNGGNAVAPESVYIGLNAIGDITELDYSNAVTQGQNHNGPGYATLSYSATTGLLTGIDDIANGTSVDDLSYTYDPLARVSTFTAIDGTGTFGYDHTSQLVSATYTTATGGHQPNNISFNWDANGNNAGSGNVVSPNNEVTNDGTFTYTFDANGSRTSRTRISTAYATDHRTTYSWDYRNRLTDVDFYDNNGVLTKHVHYVYDVYDNLIEEDIDPNGGGTYTVEDQYALDVLARPPVQVPSLSSAAEPSAADDPLLEFVNGQLTERDLNGPSQAGVDAVFGQEAVTSLNVPGTNTWIFVNNQGSPTDFVSSSGVPIDHEVWSAFGQLAYESSSTVHHLEGFSGGMVDPNTGLIKFGDPWYDPATGTWLSQSPIGVVNGDHNLTRYAGNDPASNTSEVQHSSDSLGPMIASEPQGLPAPSTGGESVPPQPTMNGDGSPRIGDGALALGIFRPKRIRPTNPNIERLPPVDTPPGPNVTPEPAPPRRGFPIIRKLFKGIGNAMKGAGHAPKKQSPSEKWKDFPIPHLPMPPIEEPDPPGPPRQRGIGPIPIFPEPGMPSIGIGYNECPIPNDGNVA